MKIILWISILSCIGIVPGAAGNGGSGYSRYGLGDIQYSATGRAFGMGGSSIAVLSSDAINSLNPAVWARIDRARFAAGALFEEF